MKLYSERTRSPIPESTLSRSELNHDFDHHWQVIKARFIEDPLTAVLQAEQLVSVMVEEWIDQVHAECATLRVNRGAAAAASTTEELRIKLQLYDDFVERMAGNRIIH